MLRPFIVKVSVLGYFPLLRLLIELWFSYRMLCCCFISPHPLFRHNKHYATYYDVILDFGRFLREK